MVSLGHVFLDDTTYLMRVCVRACACVPACVCVCVCVWADGIQSLLKALRVCVSAAVLHSTQQRGSSLSGQYGQCKVPEQPAGAGGEDGKVWVTQHSFNLSYNVETSSLTFTLLLTNESMFPQIVVGFAPDSAHMKVILNLLVLMSHHCCWVTLLLV